MPSIAWLVSLLLLTACRSSAEVQYPTVTTGGCNAACRSLGPGWRIIDGGQAGMALCQTSQGMGEPLPWTCVTTGGVTPVGWRGTVLELRPTS